MLVNPSASGVAEVLCPPVGQGPDLLWILSQPVPKNPDDVARRFDEAAADGATIAVPAVPAGTNREAMRYGDLGDLIRERDAAHKPRRR